MNYIRIFSYALIIAISTVIIGIFIYTNTKRKIEKPQITVCELIRFTKGTNSSSIYQYHVDGVEYEISFSRLNTDILGEKCLVEYEKKNPKICNLKIHQPIFKSDEVVINGTGKIVDIINWGRPMVKFEYRFESDLYYKWQRLSKEEFEKSNKIVKGVEFNVLIWVENPQRAIMKVNELDDVIIN